MKYVKIYRLQNGGEQKAIVECKLIDNEVSIDGDASFVESLKHEGIIDYSAETGKKLFPADGLKFMEQLQNNFKSGYLNASAVLEE
ncbi:hypothetical protein KKC32_01520 [Patescibacteria group bacterium]|nr:hypothetical protein [Patescibacteria group bacterium]